MDDGGDLVANFIAITGADDGVAVQMLEAANFSLEEAVNLFFAAEAAGGTHAAHTGGAGGGGGGGSAYGPGGGSGGRHAHHGLDEDGVRAPLPTKVERLYGDEYDPRGLAMAAAHQLGLGGRPPPGAGHVDVFRDFRAEGAAAAAAATAAGAGAASGAGPAGAAAADAGAAGPGPAGLSDLYKLPPDLVFRGTAEMAKARAAAEGKWLLLNVQSPTEFASHLLNRDTWGHEAFKEVLKGTFVFFQTYENSPDGRQLVKAYRLESAVPPGTPPCPAVLVVDPVTGAQLWHRAGFIDAEKLMEELVPFMDHGPLEPGAAGIAQQTMKRKASATAMAAAAAAGGSGPASRGRTPLTEDEELAMAIALSMEGGGGGGGGGAGPTGRDGGAGGGGGGGGGGGAGRMEADDDLEDAAIWEAVQAAERKAAAEAAEAAAASSRRAPEEVRAEALSRVPPEPAEGDPSSLRVALRLPDGGRLVRRFRGEDTVGALYDLGLAHVAEAAAGRRFVVTHATPGGAALEDRQQSLAAAGVAGAMLAVKLLD